MSTLYIGLDDTDTATSPGTGHLAREIASMLTSRFPVLGITRHQLLFDPRVPMTAKNSANVVHLQIDATRFGGNSNLVRLVDEVTDYVRAHAYPGSDPGLCLAIAPLPAVTEFGRRAKVDVVTPDEARSVVNNHQGLVLRALGGDGSGIIGALAAVGLAATGNDGRFTWVGSIRDVRGVQPVKVILAAGVAAVQTLEGDAVTSGLVETGDKLRPSLIDGQAVLLVEPADGRWRAVRRD
ncbi:MAG: ABC transporter substrate-binding protein [Anaerolineae bacterium]|jgi:tRNA(Ile2) C34 agmatinyltransferase TiaS